MIQHPQYADWGVECKSCHAFVPLPTDSSSAHVQCGDCGAENNLAELLCAAG